MGCDIHIVLERRKTGGTRWIGVYSTDVAHPIVRKNMVAARRGLATLAEGASA